MEKYLEKLKALGVKDEEAAKNLLKEIINDIQEKDIIHLIIYYQTGSSFETHNDVDIIDYPWNNISIVPWARCAAVTAGCCSAPRTIPTRRRAARRSP